MRENHAAHQLAVAPVRLRAQDATDANGLDAAARAEVHKILSSVRPRPCHPAATRCSLSQHD